MLTGESIPVEKGRGDRVAGRDPQRRRHAPDRGPPPRPRERPGGDRPPGPRGAGLEGRHPAPGRRRLGPVRPRRPGHRPGDPARLGAFRGDWGRGRPERGGRAHHRLPLCAGPRHADGRGRRHRQGRPCGAARARGVGLRAHGPPPHRHPRQDRDRHRGPPGRRRGLRRRGQRSRRPAPPRRRRRGPERAPLARALATFADGAKAEGFRAMRGAGVSARVGGHLVLVGSARSCPIPVSIRPRSREWRRPSRRRP